MIDTLNPVSIADYYLPRQLVPAIQTLGEIPKQGREAFMGIGFLDIAKYSFLTKFLSPRENRVLLDGLFTSLFWTIRRNGGFLNKIDGDSMMFHFGGDIDPQTKGRNDEKTKGYIARKTFFTCVEIQRAALLFNRGFDQFTFEEVDEETKNILQESFYIMNELRTNKELSHALDAFFQIRIRIGAACGTVILCNIGPPGARKLDILGSPVIEAKRMESAAPIGGLRISKELFDLLDKQSVTESYYGRFIKEARQVDGMFQNLRKDEVFGYKKILLKNKHNAEYESYSVQVNPALPESISAQIELLLNKGRSGTEEIIGIIESNSENETIVEAVEQTLRSKGVKIRKELILKDLFPSRYMKIAEHFKSNPQKTAAYIRARYSLAQIISSLIRQQHRNELKSTIIADNIPFGTYDQYMKEYRNSLRTFRTEKIYADFLDLRLTYHSFPLIKARLRAAILEYQYQNLDLEEL